MSDLSEPPPESPFSRIPSRREKLFTLATFIFLFGLCLSVPIFFGINLKNFQDWLALYGIVFFGVMTRHSWQSVNKKWSIQEDNDASRAPLSKLQSKWTILFLVGLWLLARYALP